MATPEQEAALFARVKALEEALGIVESKLAAIIKQKDKFLSWDQVEVAGEMDYLRYYPTMRPTNPPLNTIPEIEEYFGITFTDAEKQAIIAFVKDGIIPTGDTKYFLRSLLRRIKVVNGLESNTDR